MKKGRLEAFSDGVIAILITIMVLELKVPHGYEIDSLRPLLPVFISYTISFVYIAIYWNNHHHLLQAVERINGLTLWANAHLLFWLSLIPFSTAWMGENEFSTWPVVIYGLNLLLCGVAYSILTRSLVSLHDEQSTLARAVGRDLKGNASLAIYIFALGMAFFNSWISYACYIAVAIMWLVPDRRIEDAMAKE